ncbi:putative dihydrofolate synthetase [Golovinomyces cichoracearum]|uniref:Dihydrofolate synthetase n=1 Tax=Golovinomyces cichoracearum TaxID=62708 RepID=A0A420J903_9PEZI|nr:putative dihydrofolate synthetase [Golovinomyces cichoracearum]
MINLGLSRMSRLLRHTPQTWKGIHVAGTNGKGSICAYLSAMLSASGVRCGRFTSPHLIDRWDGITINDKTIEKSIFMDAENFVKENDKINNIKATEFEIITATAFEVFAREKIELGVIEVGLGGRLDSTNVMEKKIVTVISKIGLDHQSWLGNSIEQIAREKAGIMRPGVPCILDKSNPMTVRRAIMEHAREIGTEVILSSTDSHFFKDIDDFELEPHQRDNLACAYTAFHLGYTNSESPLHRLLPAVQNVSWPGRLQTLNINSITERQEPILLDGAHNAQSAQVLGNYVNKKLRTDSQKITWVIAASQGKELADILKPLLHHNDHVGAVKFHPVDRMPWVKATEPMEILSIAHQLGVNPYHSFNSGSNLPEILQWATAMSNGGPLVIAGSLYLVSDVLRLLRDAESIKNRLLNNWITSR